MPPTITRLENRRTGQSLAFLPSPDGRTLELESHWRPHTAEPPAHYHPQQTETFTVLRGALTVRLHGRVRVLRTGETLVIPPNAVHAMWNAGDEPAAAHWTTEPALRTGEFLRTIFGLAHDGQVGPSGAPGLLQSALTVGHFRAEFRLAAPPYAVQRLAFGVLGALARLRGLEAVYKPYQRG